jgi:hypothetical protein
MSQSLELLSVPNLLSKRRKLQRDINHIQTKADIHMNLKEGLNAIAVEACRKELADLNTDYEDETLSSVTKMSLKYKIEKMNNKLEQLEHFMRPQYCVNCDLRAEALKEQLDMIEAILKQRNVTTP